MATASATEPRDLNAEDRKAWQAIEAARRDMIESGAWPRHLGTPGVHQISHDDYPDIPADPDERVRLEWRVYALGCNEPERRNTTPDPPEPIAVTVTPITAAAVVPAEGRKRNVMMNWLRAFRDDSNISKDPHLCATLGAIAARCDAFTGKLDRKCSTRLLARDCGMGDHTVRRKLKMLEDAGYLRRVDGGPGRASEYRLTVPETAVNGYE